MNKNLALLPPESKKALYRLSEIVINSPRYVDEDTMTYADIDYFDHDNARRQIKMIDKRIGDSKNEDNE